IRRGAVHAQHAVMARNIKIFRSRDPHLLASRSLHCLRFVHGENFLEYAIDQIGFADHPLV
ncbi:MAG: hypothetical protein ACK5AC_07220, partial [Planctomycetota bacterium]